MGTRHEGKAIYGWGWLGDAAEEAAVRAMAPARRAKSASTAAKQKSPAGRTHVPAKRGVARLSDDNYRQLAKQEYAAEGKIEIDSHGRVSRSGDHTGEIGAWVQAWVFVGKPGSK
jgi:hypothetical protein